MSEKFTVEIITPDSSILKTDASEVVIPSYEGDMGILKDHISLITFLRPGLIKIINDSEKKFFVEEGTVEFSNNNLLILTSTVKNIENLDKNSIDTIIRRSEEQMNKDNISDKEKYLLAYKVNTLKEIN
tara:strand:- start:25 stop:411 length:387 start_codon:yes stop_codon:yes gene_type:complete